MNELDKKIDYVTQIIKGVCKKYPNDNEQQYRVFMGLMYRAGLKVACPMERYLKLRKLLAQRLWPENDYSVHFEYENSVRDLFGIFVPIGFI